MKDPLQAILGIAVLVIGIYLFACFCTTDYIIYTLPIVAALGITYTVWFIKTDHELPKIFQPFEALLLILGGISYYVLFLMLLGFIFGFIVNKIFKIF